MDQIPKTSKITTCVVFFLLLISSCVFLSSFDKAAHSLGYYASLLSILLVLVVAILVMFAVGTTIVTWITVVVLLTFAGKRRRVLAREGRKITSDVAMYLVQVVVEERGTVAFAFATIISQIAMAWLRLRNG